MSRCFPFPPPGYEKKIRTNVALADSLIKEKEKRHKKEKKYREKKQGKEKRDNETSKEKHRDRKDKDRSKEKSRISEDRKAVGLLLDTEDREKLVTYTLQNNGDADTKFILDLARRITNEEAIESRSPQKISFPCGTTENHISCPVSQANHRKDDERRIDNHRNFAMDKRSKNGVFRVSSCTDLKETEVMVKPLEKKDQVKKKELQEKKHHKESVTRSDKPLDGEVIKKSEAKYTTHRSSQEKKETKTEVINKTDQEKLRYVEGGTRLKERDLDTTSFQVQELSKAKVKNLTAQGILGKRKDDETNGLLNENGFRPNKIQRPVTSPITSSENGIKLGACQTPPRPVFELQGTEFNPEVKEGRINGFIDSQEPKSCPTVYSVKVKENGEESAKKRPHSDLKYLDKILSVPKREELHEIDDDEQEWLFGQSSVRLFKKQITDSTTLLDETPQVWNQALRIESADTIALPYVVPF
ncbi:unnamed protein product [Cochlearia groenlandica]